MTTSDDTIPSLQEQLSALAEAILYLAERCGRTWDYDSEAMFGEGIDLPDEIVETLNSMRKP